MPEFKLLRRTIGDQLERNALDFGPRDAAVYLDSGTRWSWEQLHRRAEAAARGLLALGIRHGDHVAIWGTNRPEWLLTQMAAAMIGAPLVTLNPEWKARELEYALKQSRSRLLVMFPGFVKTSGNKQHRYDFVETLAAVLPRSAQEGRVASQRLPHLRQLVLVGNEAGAGLFPWASMIELGHMVPAAALHRARSEVAPDDAALIQYTSGTTGFPKGAILTHLGVVNNARIGAENLGLGQADRICVTVPYYHCFGSIIVNIGALVSGAATVVPCEHFDAHRTLEAIAAEKCTVLHGVPTMFLSELEDIDFEAHDLSTLRTGIMAGSPCPPELMREVTQRMGLDQITIGYGLTEASPLTHQTLPTDPPEKRMHTVGRPIPGTDARIVDPGTGETLGPGHVGEIQVRGFHVMQGYYRCSEETAEAIRDGWLRTGDLGQVDTEGYYRVVGRLKELIIVGGHNVYPVEVEQSILSMFEDRVEMVQVVGVPHPRLQEVVAAVIRKKKGSRLGEQEVLLSCRQQMEWPKVPRHVVFTDDFSDVMTVTGKIQKFKLKQRLQGVDRS